MSILAHVMRGAGRGDPGALGRRSAVTCGPAAPVGCAQSCAAWWLGPMMNEKGEPFWGLVDLHILQPLPTPREILQKLEYNYPHLILK